MVLFLTRVLDQENATAANNVSKWTGTVYLFSLVGAFLSDSYWGRYLTCAIFQIILVVVIYHLQLYFLKNFYWNFFFFFKFVLTKILFYLSLGFGAVIPRFLAFLDQTEWLW